jgi:radical SAM protein with 4Fe4S-binding SPASM domain
LRAFLNYLALMSIITKQANLLKAGYSFLRSSATGNTTIAGMPVSISTELTNNCNLNCPQCTAGSGRLKRKRGFMDIELFKKVMMECGPYLYNVNLYFQGEPMLHPLFFAFLENSPVTEITVSTNGHFLTAENAEKIVSSRLSKLIVSLDGTDQDTYSAYRTNGDMRKVVEGLECVALARKRYSSSLKIELQFLVNKLNENQIPEVKKLAEIAGVSLRLKSMQILDTSKTGEWLPTQKKYSRYKNVNGEYVIKSPLPDRCARAWFNPVITWDGHVVPCCFDKNAEYVMGDLKVDSFREIWNGPKYRMFRKSILTGRNTIEICRNCTSGLRGVKY